MGAHLLAQVALRLHASCFILSPISFRIRTISPFRILFLLDSLLSHSSPLRIAHFHIANALSILDSILQSRHFSTVHSTTFTCLLPPFVAPILQNHLLGIVRPIAGRQSSNRHVFHSTHPNDPSSGQQCASPGRRQPAPVCAAADISIIFDP